MPKLDLSNACKPLADIFASAQEREEQRRAEIGKHIIELEIDRIDDFPRHPFKVRDDAGMRQLAESIRENGVLTPAVVTRKADGRYEMVSGHRRKFAARLAGLETIPCEVLALSPEEAVLHMVDSNLQRTEILPSERAFAYKMRMDALKRKAGRKSKKNGAPMDPNSSGSKNWDPLGPNFGGGRSSEQLAVETGDTMTQIKRFIRLTELIPALLDMVDERKLAFRPAVSLSYLLKSEQKVLLGCIRSAGKAPNMAQAERIRALSQEKQCTQEAVLTVLESGKARPAGKFTLPRARFAGYFPDDATPDEMANIIEQALRLWKEQHP